jgi:Domain of unknown function (DUF5655)/Domain of unknown function (DUF4287)
MPDPMQSMITSLEAKTGRGLEWWVALVRGSGLEAHGAVVEMLKADHGIGHGYANMVAHTAFRSSAAFAEPYDLLDAQYAGKEHLRPIHDAVVAAVRDFGPDVEIAPKKAAVSLRRSRQFALVTPATRTRVDLGLNLRGEAPAGRLEVFPGMCTHRIRLTHREDVDREVLDWLRAAYSRA